MQRLLSRRLLLPARIRTQQTRLARQTYFSANSSPSTRCFSQGGGSLLPPPAKPKETKEQNNKTYLSIFPQGDKDNEYRQQPSLVPKADDWNKQYEKLVEFKQKNGHCSLPQRNEGDASLGRWVARQRSGNNNNTIRPDRKELLDEIGFVWKAVTLADRSSTTDVRQVLSTNPTDDSSSSSSIPYPFHLNEWYRDNHAVGLNDAFEPFELAQPDGRHSLWTSTFICPINHDRIPSGKLDGAQEIDGMFFYTKKKVAIRAAAMAALDFLNVKQQPTTVKPVSSVRREINAWYEKRHETILQDDMFVPQKTSLKGKKVGGTWWTATFMCPLSGVQYEAASLREVEGIHRDAGKVCWYRSKVDAIAATASRAMDILKFQDSGISEPRYCDEDPALFDPAEEDDSDDDRGPRNLTRQELNMWYNNQELYTWYNKKHNINLQKKSSFVATKILLKGDLNEPWWTASFVCPLSGRRYDAGSLKDFSGPIYTGADSVKWYRQKGDAIAAAGSRALDSLRFEETGVEEGRCCIESPSGVQNVTDDIQKMQNATVLHKEAEDDDEVYEIQQVRKSIDVHVGDQQVEEEEEYIIQHVPQQSIGSASSSTLDLIAETWIDSATGSQRKDPSTSRRVDPLAERKNVIDKAFEWIRQQMSEQKRHTHERIQFDNQYQLASVKIANLMLKSLAKANQGLPFNQTASGVEEAAKSILELMWSSRSTKPDADSYAAYIRCLEGGSLSTVAKRGQAIYDAMKSGTTLEGRILPKPNVSATNAMIQLSAQVGEKVAQSDFYPGMVANRDTFLSMLSCTACPPANTRESTGFDASYAHDCMKAMRELHEKSGDESLRPDTQVYNAPLRWSGGLLSNTSRPYARCAPWDAYDKIFRRGFKLFSEDDLLFQEASAIDAWLKDMERDDSPSPNLETFESVIQAWVRTGTLEGLVRAEDVANRLLKSPVAGLEVRLQTFHPIIAAWVFSGANNGPEKVQEWVDRLDANPDVLLDGRIRATPAMAHLSRQNRVLERLEGIDTPDSHNTSASLGSASDRELQSMVVESAKSSAECLRALVNDIVEERRDILLDAENFSIAIRTWYNAALVSCRSQDSESVELAVAEMIQVTEDFDALLAALQSKYDDVAVQGSSEQCLHMMRHAARVYSAAVLGVRDIDQYVRGYHARVEENDRGHILQHAQSLEKMVRRVSEFHMLLDEMSTKTSQAENGEITTSEDLFMYQTKKAVIQTTSQMRMALYDQIIQASGENYVSTRRDADVLRLCMLIHSVLKAEGAGLDPFVTNVYKSLIGLLKKLEINSLESDKLLGRVVQDLDGMRTQNHSRSSSGLNALIDEIKSSMLDSDGVALSIAKSAFDSRVRRRRGRGRDTRRNSPPRSIARNVVRRRKQSQ
jgi:hypothetical protein